MERSTSEPCKSEMPTCFDYALITMPVPNSSVPAASYFALPGEIRNKIMHLVLCPGHIYLRSKPTASNHYISYSNDPDNATQSPPGIQLLATCRQAYNEGHALYYSANVFHLPPGPLSATEAILNNIQPESLSLIHHINLTTGLLDLASLLEEVETCASQAEDCYIVNEGCSKQALKALYSLLKAKGLFLITKVLGVRAVKYEVRMHTTERTEALDLSSKGWRPLDEQQWIRGPLQIAAIRVGVYVREIIRDLGWEAFKASLSPGRLQLLEREDLEEKVLGIFEFSANTSVFENRLNRS